MAEIMSVSVLCEKVTMGMAYCDLKTPHKLSVENNRRVLIRIQTYSIRSLRLM